MFTVESKVGQVHPKSISMTEKSISGISGLIREAFGDSTMRIANIFTIHCHSGQCGVVDTSLGYDYLE